MADSLAIALDLGTTSVKAGILNETGQLVSVISRQAPAVRQQGNRYESNASHYRDIAGGLLERCLTTAEGKPHLGISCQRSSFLLWEKTSGEPVSKLISWQDTRSESLCQKLQDYKPLIKSLSGLQLTPFFLAGKLAVVLDENPEWRRGLETKELLVGTLDTFLIWSWAEGHNYQMDMSMAARTLLLDIKQKAWSADLCKIFQLSSDYLPKITCSEDLSVPLIQGVELKASLADQSSAMLCSVSQFDGEVLVNLGTGGFIGCLIDSATFDLQNGYLHTLIYRDRLQRNYFAIEATLNSIAGALAPHPFRDCSFSDLAELDDYYCISEPSGIGAPYFRNDIALTYSKPVENLSRKQIACLLLEGIIFRVAYTINEINKMFGLKRIVLSGGLSRLDTLQQGITICSPLDVYVLDEAESSLTGVARLAANQTVFSESERKKIEKREELTRILKKYYGWCIWFNDLLTD